MLITMVRIKEPMIANDHLSKEIETIWQIAAIEADNANLLFNKLQHSGNTDKQNIKGPNYQFWSVSSYSKSCRSASGARKLQRGEQARGKGDFSKGEGPQNDFHQELIQFFLLF